MLIDWTRFAEIIAAHQRFVISSHMRPDCDALGSELAMAAILRSLGKSAEIINGDATPPHLAFIDPNAEIRVLGDDATAADIAAADAYIVLDTSSRAQLGPMAAQFDAFNGARIVIDHHVSDEAMGAETFKDASAEATGHLVIDAADALAVRLTKEMSAPLFAAIATDTGWFRFPSVTAGTYRAIARLIDAGASPQQLYSQLYENESLARLHLRGRILAAISLEAEGRLAYSMVTQADFAECRAEPSDTEDVINYMLRVPSVEVALLLTEREPGTIRISFRSRGKADVRQLAEQFDGGGHTMAAGATIFGPLFEARDKILDAARRTVG